MAPGVIEPQRAAADAKGRSKRVACGARWAGGREMGRKGRLNSLSSSLAMGVDGYLLITRNEGLRVLTMGY